MGNLKWLKDLSEGQKGERVVAEHFTTKYRLTDIIYNNDYRYDFKGIRSGETISFEVKTDRYEYFKGYNTYNLFIEISCSGNPSGISNSQADNFVYYFPDLEQAYIIPMAKLRLLVMTNDLQLTEQSGDGGRVQGYLVHRNLFKDWFNIITIKKDENIWGNK